MQFHIDRHPLGSKRVRRSHNGGTHFAIMIVASAIITTGMVRWPLQKHHRSAISRTMHSYLFRITHAWTIIAPTAIPTTRRIFSNRYDTRTSTTPTNDFRCGGIRQRHRFHHSHLPQIPPNHQVRPLLAISTCWYSDWTTTRQRLPVRLFATNEIDMHDDDNVSNVHEYTERECNEWQIPAKIEIPEDRIEMKFVRSSGAGGQNVNKVSSCVQIRFHVMSAEWMGPLEVRQRFSQQYRNSIGKHDGVFHMESQVYRTQTDNRKDVLRKLEAAILQVWPRPKMRKLRVGLTEQGKRKRREEKEKQSSKKEGRRSQRFDY